MQRSVFYKAYSILTPEQRKQSVVVVVLLVFQSLLDFFSIASFLPLIFLIVNPDFIQTNGLLRELYLYFNFQSAPSFIITVTVLILMFTLFKGISGFWVTRLKANFIFQVGSQLSS